MVTCLFGTLQVGQKFRNIVDAEHIVKMKIECAGNCCAQLPDTMHFPNVVEIEGSNVGRAEFYVDEAVCDLAVD